MFLHERARERAKEKKKMRKWKQQIIIFTYILI